MKSYDFKFLVIALLTCAKHSIFFIILYLAEEQLDAEIDRLEKMDDE